MNLGVAEPGAAFRLQRVIAQIFAKPILILVVQNIIPNAIRRILKPKLRTGLAQQATGDDGTIGGALLCGLTTGSGVSGESADTATDVGPCLVSVGPTRDWR